MNGSTLALAGIPLTALVLGLTEVAKQAGLDSKWAALLAVALGALGGLAVFAAASSNTTLVNDIVLGVASGLSASGIFSGVKAIQVANAATPAKPADPAPVTPAPPK